jgi:putative inorganic carbon (HCO3(-)) transporter
MPPLANTAALLTGGGTVLAALAVALFSLFPGARLVALLLTMLAATLWGAGRRKLWLRTPLDGLILLLLVQVGVAFWASALPEQTWVAACQLGAGLVAYYTVVNWSRTRAQLWWAVAALVLLGLGLALVAPFAVDWFQNRKTFLPPALYRFFPLLLPDSIHPNVMASSLATLLPLPLALSLALSGQSRRQRWLRGALLAVCALQLLVLLLTKSRGGYLALGVSLWLTLWLSGRRRWAIGLTVVAALLVVWLLTRPLSETSTTLDTSQQAALDSSTWAFRQQVWRAALQTIADFPFTGTGMGTFNDVAALLYGLDAPDNPQAHNLFFQVAIDLGMLGLISFLSIQFLVLWAAFRAYRLYDSLQEPTLRAIAIGGLSGTVATLAHGLVDVHTWGSKGAFIPWMMLGLVVALYTLALAQELEQR